jgi:hypothetical protein
MESAQLKADVDDPERAVGELLPSARPHTSDVGLPAVSTSARIEDGPHVVALSPADLGAMGDVFTEDVFAHLAAGVGYEAAVPAGSDGDQVLTIMDEGPGFAGVSMVKRRRSDDGGTGLGLDIVARTAQSTGGGMGLPTTPSGGAMIGALFRSTVSGEDPATGS